MSEFDSESDRESAYGPDRSCDPCDGQCPLMLQVGIVLLGVAKMLVVAPLALVIIFGCFLVGTIVLWASMLLWGLWMLLTFCKWPAGIADNKRVVTCCNFKVDSIWKARLYVLLYPIVCTPIVTPFLLLPLLVFAPIFAVVKPILDTWTAWKWQTVFGFGSILDFWTWGSVKYNAKSKTNKGEFACNPWTKARKDCGNGTIGVLVDAFYIGFCLAAFFPYIFVDQTHEWSRYRRTFELEHETVGSKKASVSEGDLAWEAFFQQMLQVGESAIQSGLVTRLECQELAPFLMLGLPGLVLLRFVVRTCFDDEGDKPVDELLQFLGKAYRDQGEGRLEYFDGMHIIEYDESDAYAEDDWLDAKEVVEAQGFFDVDDEEEDDDEEEEWNAYAIFEAWVLFGERPDNSELRGKVVTFLAAYEELSEDRRVGINRAASKIREVALIITKAPSFQERFMKVMEELGKNRCCFF